MSDRLETTVRAAVASLFDDCRARLPLSADRVQAWMRVLSPGDDPADYFLHPRAFPFCALPLWLSEATGQPLSDDLLLALTRSSVAGYYRIRLLDDVMDGELRTDKRLLPAIHWLDRAFLWPYQARFAHDDPFWQDFEAIWVETADCTCADAFLEGLDEERFRTIAARKVAPAHIPLLALARLSGQQAALPQWRIFLDELGCWYQFVNDLYDWRKDLELGLPTWFLTQARRFPVPAVWVLETGFDQGVTHLQRQLDGLKAAAAELGSPALRAFLASREATFQSRAAQARAGFDVLRPLILAVTGPGRAHEPEQ